MFGPIWVLIPDQRPTVAASNHHIGESITVDIAYCFDMWILGTFLVNNGMLEMQEFISPRIQTAATIPFFMLC